MHHILYGYAYGPSDPRSLLVVGKQGEPNILEIADRQIQVDGDGFVHETTVALQANVLSWRNGPWPIGVQEHSLFVFHDLDADKNCTGRNSVQFVLCWLV